MAKFPNVHVYVIYLSFFQTLVKQEMFQKHTCPPPPWCKIQNYYLCTRHYEFGTSHKAELNINEIRVKDYIIMITHWAKNSGLTLTSDHVTWKSTGIICSLGVTSTPRLVLIKQRGQKMLSRQHTGPRTVNWLWPLIMWSKNQ